MNADARSNTVIQTPYRPAGTTRIMWLIAWRQMVEAMRTRSTIIMVAFFLAFQTAIVLFALKTVMGAHTREEIITAGVSMAFYLLWVGLMPCTPAIGVAAGVFAGDKERGCLTPLLVTPASNTAIFAGKVLGAVIPALLYACIGVLVYFAEIVVLFGADKLAWLPLSLAVPLLLVIPAMAIFGTALASIISSRVSTFQSAQNYSSLILMVLWIALSALVLLIGFLGIWAMIAGVIATYVIDGLLIFLAATTWRREEVMAQL